MKAFNDWNFTGYEKISTSSKNWQLDEAGERLLAKVPWVVTEKIHGANFCLVTDGKKLRCAKRKEFLANNENFFTHQEIVAKLEPCIKKIFHLFNNIYQEINLIYVYGELFGGGYPHPDVIAEPLLQPIQTGIYYSPKIEFCAFDLAIETKQQHTYIDYEQAISIFQQVNLFYAIPLFIGKYTEALAYPYEFTSTIPQLLKLPPLAEINKAEGIVIKPLKNLIIDTPKGKIRPILKLKIPEFAEDKRYQEAQKWSEKTPKKNTLELLKWEAFNLITETRLNNAISKIGYCQRGEKSRARQLFRLLVEDIFEELGEYQLTGIETDKLQNFITEELRILIKKYLAKESRKV